MEKGSSNNEQLTYGLTKREHIAALAMQGLLSERPNYPDPTTVANWATAYADALLERLAR